MIGPKIRPVSPGHPNADVIRQLTKSVNGLRNMRPVTTAFGMVQTPWGQATVPGAADFRIAYTAPGGVSKASETEAGKLVLGAGEAYEAYPTNDPDSATIVIEYQKNTDHPLRVYNLAKEDDGAVGGNKWIIIQRFWTIWVVTWEECDPQ